MSSKNGSKYTTVRVSGRTLRIANNLSETTNKKRGYCNSCSGNGTRPTTSNHVTICGSCNGTGRA